MSCDSWPVAPFPCDPGENAPLFTAWAQQTLSAASGHRFARCEYTERIWSNHPCSCLSPSDRYLAGLVHRSGCACCILRLSRSPIAADPAPVVTIAGDPFTAFSIVGDSLIRDDGSCWPSADFCANNPVTVVYTAGHAPPAGTSLAMAELVCELAAAFSGSPCRLPSRTTALVRQGVSMDLADPSVFLLEGLTGLPLCDSWIRTWNRDGLRSRSRVLDPLSPPSSVSA